MEEDYSFLTSGDLYVDTKQTIEYPNGKLVTVNKKGWDNNQGYLVYIPNNCNSNTNVDFYYPWTDGYYPNKWGESSQSAFDEYLQGGCDDIVFISKAGNNSYDSSILNSLDSLDQKYNLTNTQYNVIGHSKGANAAINATATLIEKNPDIEPINVVLLDPPYGGSTLNCNDKITNTLEGKATIIIFNNQKDGNAKSAGAVKTLANKIPVGLMLACEGHDDHLLINNEAIYNKLIDFLNGKTDLSNEEIYDYWVCDGEKCVPSNYTSIKNALFTSKRIIYSRLKDINDLDINKIDFSLISSDLVYIYDEMNNIRNKINNNLNNSFADTSFSSTTLVPNNDLTLLTSYYNATGELLNKINNEVNVIANIGLLYSQLDKELVDEAALLESLSDNI